MHRVACTFAAAAIGLAAPAPAQTPDVYRVDYFPELPQHSGGVQLRFLGPSRGTVTQTRLFITFTTHDGFDASGLTLNLFARTPSSPLGGFLTITGTDLEWAGEGTFTAAFSTDQLNGPLTPGLWGFDLLGSGDPPMYSGEFSIDTRFELDIVPDVCVTDWDQNGTIEPADIAAFVQDWLADLADQTTIADIDLSHEVNPSDIAAFINRWLSALHTGC